MRFVERIGDQFREILPEPCDLAEPRIRIELRRMLADQFHLVDPEVLILAEDMQTWNGETSIDLLGLHRNGSLVIVALTEGVASQNAMELLAIRHAALAATLSSQNLLEAHKTYLGTRTGAAREDAERRILQFLGLRSLDALQLSAKPRILLIAQDFGSQLTQSVLWLNSVGLEIQCVRVDLYRVGTYFMLRSAANALEAARLGAPLPEVQATPRMTYATIESGVAHQATPKRVEFEQAASIASESATEMPCMTPTDATPMLPLHETVGKALACGHSPQQITDFLPHIPVLFRILPGELGSAAFKAANREFRTKVAMADDSDAFYANDGELFHYKGKTYALAKLAPEVAEKTVTSLLRTFPELNA